MERQVSDGGDDTGIEHHCPVGVREVIALGGGGWRAQATFFSIGVVSSKIGLWFGGWVVVIVIGLQS